VFHAKWYIRRSGVQEKFLIDGSQGYFAEKEDCAVVYPGRVASCIFAALVFLIAAAGVWLVSYWIKEAQHVDAALGAVIGLAVLFWFGKKLRENFSEYLWIHDRGLPYELRIGDNITPSDIQRVIVTETYRVGRPSVRSFEVGLQLMGRRDFVSLKRTSISRQAEQIELGKRLARRWNVECMNLEAILENSQFDKRLPLTANCFWEDAADGSSGKENPDTSSPQDGS